MLSENIFSYGSNTLPSRAYASLKDRLAPRYRSDVQLVGRELEDMQGITASEIFMSGLEFLKGGLGNDQLARVADEVHAAIHNGEVKLAFAHDINYFLLINPFQATLAYPTLYTSDNPTVVKWTSHVDKPDTPKVVLTAQFLRDLNHYPIDALAWTGHLSSVTRDVLRQQTDEGQIAMRADATAVSVLLPSFRDDYQGNLNPFYGAIKRFPFGIENLPDGVWY